MEGLFLLKLGQSPYAGDVFHQPPLILPLFYSIQNDPWLIRAAFIIIDLLCALAIRGCVQSYQKQLPSHVAKAKDSVILRPDLGNIAASM